MTVRKCLSKYPLLLFPLSDFGFHFLTPFLYFSVAFVYLIGKIGLFFSLNMLPEFPGFISFFFLAVKTDVKITHQNSYFSILLIRP